MDIEKIIELHRQAIALNSKYNKKRFVAQKIMEDSGNHFVGVIGPRGVGKSVLFRQLASLDENSIYISIDSVDFENLFELVKTLYETYGYKKYFLDEIHFYKDYEKDLKTIYDFLGVKVFFTSSVSLSLYESAYDLSRRVKIYDIFPFSYREYLFFREDKNLNVLRLVDIKNKEWRPEHIRNGHLFRKYISGALMPFSLEEADILPMMENILDKIIFKDIPLVASLRIDELDIIKKIVGFIGKSQIDGISYSTLSNNLKITKYKAEQYIKLLQKAFVVNVILPRGTNVLKEPKIVLGLPFRLLYKDYDEAIGGLREDYFVGCVKMSGMKINYLKTKKGKKTPDYIVEENGKEYIVEVGGKGKGISQFKGIDLEKSIIFADANIVDGIKRPLFLSGFLS